MATTCCTYIRLSGIFHITVHLVYLFFILHCRHWSTERASYRFFPAVLWQMMMARCNLGKEYAPQLMESSALWDEYRALWETEANCTTLAGKCLSQRLSDSAAPSRSSLNEWLLLLRPFYWPGKGREKKKKTCRSSHSLQNKWRY